MTPFKPRIKIQSRMFTNLFNFARPAQTGDDAGGRVQSTPYDSPILYSQVPCSLQPIQAHEQQYFGRFAEVVSHVILTNQKMVLLTGDFGLFEGRIFVVQVVKNISTLGCLYTIAAQEIVTTAQ